MVQEPFSGSEGCVETCSVHAINRETVERVRSELPPVEEAEAAADIFKMLGDPTRMKLLLALSRARLCVCDLSAITGMTHSAISHQLRLLRTARIVRGRREGKMVFYTLDDAHIERLVADGLAHVREDRRE